MLCCRYICFSVSDSCVQSTHPLGLLHWYWGNRMTACTEKKSSRYALFFLMIKHCNSFSELSCFTYIIFHLTMFAFIRILIANCSYLCSINQSQFIDSILEERCPIWMLWLPCPESKFHGANIGPIWGRQDPGGPHVGPMDFALWVNIALVPFMAAMLLLLRCYSSFQI